MMRGILGHRGLLLNTIDPDAQTLIDRFDVPPTGGTISDIDTLIRELKDQGIWAISDTIYIPKHAQDQQSGLLDWKRPTKAATLNGAASWSANDGFVGAASVGAYVSTDFTPSTDAVNLQLNNACYWMYVTALPTNTHYYYGRTGGAAARAVYISGGPTGTDDAKIHSNAGNSGTAGHVQAGSLICMQRTGATAWAMYRDGVLLHNDIDSSASSALSEVELFLLAAHNANTPGTSTGNSDAKIGAWGASSQMTTDQMAALNTALEVYFA